MGEKGRRKASKRRPKKKGKGKSAGAFDTNPIGVGEYMIISPAGITQFTPASYVVFSRAALMAGLSDLRAATAAQICLADYASSVAACMQAIAHESGVTASFPDDIGLFPTETKCTQMRD